MSIEYRGQTFPGYNKPIRNDSGSKHKMKVLAKDGDKVRLIRFGHRDYGHNINPKRKANYLKRSAGIRDKSGRLTKDNKLSANYWARRKLWPTNKPTTAEKTAMYYNFYELQEKVAAARDDRDRKRSVIGRGALAAGAGLAGGISLAASSDRNLRAAAKDLMRKKKGPELARMRRDLEPAITGAKRGLRVLGGAAAGLGAYQGYKAYKNYQHNKRVDARRR